MQYKTIILALLLLTLGVLVVSCAAKRPLQSVEDESQDPVYYDAEAINSPFREFGFGNRVNSLAFSPNGSILAIGNSEGQIGLWSVHGDTLLRQLTGHSKEVNDLSFSPDGDFVLSAGQDETAKLWQVDSGELLHTYRPERNPSALGPYNVNCIAFSPEGQKIAVGANDGRIFVYEIAHNRKLNVFDAHWDYRTDGYTKFFVNVSAIAFTDDGTKLVSCGGDQGIKTWDVGTGTIIRIRQDHRSAWDIALNSQSNSIYSSSRQVTRWDTVNPEIYQDFFEGLEENAELLCVAVSLDGKLVAAGTLYGNAIIWDARSGHCIETFHHGSEPSNINFMVHDLAFSPDGTALVTACQDGKVRFWRI